MSRNTNIRNRAFREYISTIVDCDHSTGENANASEPPSPPARAKRSVGFVSPPVRSVPSIMSDAERQMSIEVQPAAKAPNTAERSDIA